MLIVLLAVASNPDICKTLRDGISDITNMTPAKLLQPGTIAQIVREIGLYSPVSNGGGEPFKMSYADEYAKSVIKKGLTKNGYAASPSELHGLWQSPTQLECAMTHLIQKGESISTHLTVGTYSGWTDLVIHAILRKYNPNLHTVITDQNKHYHSCVDELIASIGQIKFQKYKSSSRKCDNKGCALDKKLGTVDGNFSQFGDHFDFCFVDSNHDYYGTGVDVKKASKICKFIMIHDIVQSSGVRALWHKLAEHAGPAAKECIEQPGPTSAKDFERKWLENKECSLNIHKFNPRELNRCNKPGHLMGIGILESKVII